MFIKVFTEEDKEKLISNGYNLIFTEEANDRNIYTFEQNERFKFDLTQVKHIETTRINF